MGDERNELTRLTITVEKFITATEYRFKVLEEDRHERRAWRTKVNLALITALSALPLGIVAIIFK